ncbi:MAG: BrnT family toxin [Spirochaetaceae bacterium]|nr:MAG: BrnT family toxin [Spirochaetaceae bacterium]
MYPVSFEWDETKNRDNQQTHGVSFEEAQSVFLDENAVQFYDEVHSDDEERYIMVRLSSHLRLLLVVHTFRETDGVIRIISARKPTAKESRVFLESRQ